MADRLDVLEELSQRGDLPAQKKAVVDELLRRERGRAALEKGYGVSSYPGPNYERAPGDYNETRALAAKGASGIAMEGFDELTAAAQTLLGDLGSDNFLPDYDLNLANMRAEMRAIERDQPEAAMGAEMAGALGTGLAIPGVGGGMAARVLGNAAIGTGLGATYGFASGEGGANQRAQSALVPGVIGMAAGALSPIVGGLLNKGGSAVQRAITARRTGVPPAAVNQVQRALQADEILQPGVAQRPMEMLADAGPASMARLDAAITKRGAPGVAAQRAINDRTSRTSSRVVAALDDYLGTPQGTRTIERGLREQSRSPVNAAYEVAYSKPIDYAGKGGLRIEEIIRSRPNIMRRAIREANELMEAEGATSKQIKATIVKGNDGVERVVYEIMPDVRQVDYITRGLNQVADVEAGKGAMGRQTSKGRAIQNLSRELRNLLKDEVPEYADALKLAADPIQARNALNLGRDFRRLSADQIAADMIGMTDMERRFVAQGVRETIDDVMANVQRAFTDPHMDSREAAKMLKLMLSRASRNKVAKIIGDEPAAKLYTELDDGVRAFELRASVAENSKTAARQSLIDEVDQGANEGVVNALRDVSPTGVVRESGRALFGNTAADKAARADKVYGAIVEAMTSPSTPQSVQRLLQATPPAQRGLALRQLAEVLVKAGAMPAIPATR